MDFNRMLKTVYILTGLKGSGKTYIGDLLSKRLNIPFLRVEDIFLRIKTDDPLNDQDYILTGFTNVETEIRKRLSDSDHIIIESTGIATQFNDMVRNLKNDFAIKLIKIDSDPDLCLQRIKFRDQSKHIAVSDDHILEINKRAGKVSFPYDLVIVNNDKQDLEIVQEFCKIHP